MGVAGGVAAASPATSTSTLAAASWLWATAGGRTSSSRSPAPPRGSTAIEEAIFAGVPVNVTLLFSREQYLAAAAAYMRGVERGRGRARPGGGVGGVGLREPLGHLAGGEGARRALRNALGIAQARSAMPPTASCSTRPAGAGWPTRGRSRSGCCGRARARDPEASDVLYVRALAAPDRQHDAREDPPGLRRPRRGVRLPACRRGDAQRVTTRFADGVDLEALAERLQAEGAAAFVTSWDELLQTIEERSAALAGRR